MYYFVWYFIVLYVNTLDFIAQLKYIRFIYDMYTWQKQS